MLVCPGAQVVPLNYCVKVSDNTCASFHIEQVHLV